MHYVNQPTKVTELLEIYRKNKKIYQTEKIKFLGVGTDDVYNISKKFKLGNAFYIAGRVEKRDSEVSKVCFFKRIEDHLYLLDPKAMVIEEFQDPSVAFVNDHLIVCGTKIEVARENKSSHITSWHTAFYKGKTLSDLEMFGRAPDKMKDVRIIAYHDKIALFSRPQGGIAGPGKIGFIMINTLNDVKPEMIKQAALLHEHFIDAEWGGANELHLLKNGLIGVLGHISMRDVLNKLHYYPMVFAFDPKTQKSTQIKIIAERSDFKAGPSKRADLVDVLFSGGLERLNDKKAILYTGVSDAEAHFIIINDPFIEYEHVNGETNS